MPIVDGQRFPYTPEGQANAATARRRTSTNPTHRPDLESTQSGVRRRLASTPITPPTQPMGLPSATPTPPSVAAGRSTDPALQQLLQSLRTQQPAQGPTLQEPGGMGLMRQPPRLGLEQPPMLGGPRNSLRRRGR